MLYFALPYFALLCFAVGFSRRTEAANHKGASAPKAPVFIGIPTRRPQPTARMVMAFDIPCQLKPAVLLQEREVTV